MAWLFSRAGSQEDLKGEHDDDDLNLDLENEEKEFQPPCSLEICTNLQTGEEEEVELYVQRSKMFRFALGKWKERGIGNARLLRNTETGSVRFVMRQEKTFKVIANHYVTNQSPYCDLQPLSESTLFWVWRAQNAIDDEVVDEMVALKFDTAELSEGFAQAFNSSKANMPTPSLNERSSPLAPLNLSTDEQELVEEEEVLTVDGWTPSLTLEVLEMQTGEEQEEVLYRQCSKLFRFRDGEWRERGKGDASLLRNSATGTVRLLMREEKTRKVLANHAVAKMPPYCDIRPGAGSDRTWVWLAQNYAEYLEDGQPSVEQLALKLGSTELAQQFGKAWESALEQDPRGFMETSTSSPKRPLCITDARSSPTPARKAARGALEERNTSRAVFQEQPQEDLGFSCDSPVSNIGHTDGRDLIPMRSRTLSELDRSEQFFSALAGSKDPVCELDQNPTKQNSVPKSGSQTVPICYQPLLKTPALQDESQVARRSGQPSDKSATPDKRQVVTVNPGLANPTIQESHQSTREDRIQEFPTTSFNERRAIQRPEVNASSGKSQMTPFGEKRVLKKPEGNQLDQDERPDSILAGGTSVKDLVASINKGNAIKAAVSQMQNSHKDWRQRAGSVGRSVRSTQLGVAGTHTCHDTLAVAKRSRDDDTDGSTSKRLCTHRQQAIATIPTPQQQLASSDRAIMERLGNVAGRLERFAGVGADASELALAMTKPGYIDLKKLLVVADRIEAATKRLIN